MIWNYDDSWRDKFETCEHRDILIVPHATNVIGVEGGPPEITSKVPKFDANGDPIPGEYTPVEFVITNEDIYKEKFEYTNSLDTNEDLAFCGCESAMVKFTIRNNKTYDEEKGIWVMDIPNLQTYILTGEQQGDSNLPTLVGEIQTHYIIKLYMYFNGDSSSLIYMGMFIVEEDKVSSDGYTRDITAFDFLYQFRDMDIYNWYYHMFRGVNYQENDYDRYQGITDSRKPSGITDAEWEAGWIRKPPENGYWTIGEMLTDLIKNIATRYPSEKTVTNRETTKFVDATGNEVNYPPEDTEPYTGYAMPIVLDPDLFDDTKTYSIPTASDPDARECYGYMPILNLKVYEDPKIMDSGALSAGKFLEDIGALAGRYPYIRIDKPQDDTYHPLVEYDPANPESPDYYPYNLYEKCVLTFKPLPKNDEPIALNNYFDNSDIAKGFKHDYYSIDTVHIWELYTRFDDKEKPTFSYANLTKAQRQLSNDCPDLIKKLQMSNNMFIDYITEVDDDIKLAKDPPKPEPSTAELKERYLKVKNVLLYGEEVVEPVTKDMKNGLLHDGYKKIKYRTYTPFELTTFADPVREVGDRIQIHFEDKITGEVFEFPTYILSRKLSGIQKMMDTYVAKGNVSNQTFSNYKTGTTYAPQSMGYYGRGSSSGSIKTAGGTNLTGLTANDFVEIIRNIGFRLLNEPSSVSARFVATSTSTQAEVRVINSSSYSEFPKQGESDIHTGDTTNPIAVWNQNEEIEMFNVSAGDYFIFIRYGDGIEYSEYEDHPLYLYDGSKWVYAGYNASGGSCNIYFDDYAIIEEYNDITEGSTIDTLTMKPQEGETYFLKERVENTNYYHYGYSDDSGYGEKMHGTVTFKPSFGDSMDQKYGWQYPGFWTSAYPKPGEITIKSNPHVELKWTDPENIAEWEPKPCSWEGTIVVRKLNAPPLNRWDGVLITDSIVRDQYSENAYIDDTIELNRVYYYGIFPYYTAIQDAQHPIKYYRFTKVIRVSTGKAINAPEILSIERI